jgi:translocation and assembly module TamB
MLSAPTDLAPPPPSHPHPRRPWWLRLLAWVALGLAVLLLLIGGVLSALATSSGSRWVIDQALEASQQAGSPAQAKLTGVSGSLLGRLELRGLTLADDQGVWLSADRLALEWRPWHLLKGRLWIEDISGGQIDVIRPPVTEPSSEEPVVAASSGGGFDPLLLERLTLRGLSVEALHLREGVVGPEASLSARAQMMGMALGGVGANAEIHRLDGATAITAEMTYNAQRRLALHAVIHDEQGGLLGTLSGLPEAPAISVTLDGDGPLEDWDARLFGELSEVVTLDGDLSLGLGDTMTLKGRGHLLPGPSLATSFGEAASLAVGSGVAFSLDANQQADGALQVETLSLSADAWAVQGDLALGAAGDLGGRLDVALRDGPLVQTLSGVPLVDAALALELKGSVESPRVTVDLRSSGSYVDHMTLALAADPVQGGAMRLVVDGTVDDWGPASEAWASLLGDPLDLRANGVLDSAAGTFGLSSLTVKSALASVAAQAEVDWSDGLEAKGTLEATVPTLAALAPLTGMDLKGAAAAKITLAEMRQAPGEPLHLVADLGLSTDGLALGIAQADGLLGPAVTAQVKAKVDGQTLTLADLGLKGQGLAVDGGVVLDGLDQTAPALRGSVTTRLLDLSKLQAGLQGGLSLPLTLAGTTTAPQVSGTLTGEAVQWDGMAVETLSLPIQATASHLTLTGAQVKALGAAVQSDVTLTFAPLEAKGTVALTVPQPERLQKAFGVGVGRKTALTIALAPADGKQAASLDGLVDGVGMDGLKSGPVTLKGRFDDLIGAPRGGVTVALSDLALGGDSLRFERLQAEAQMQADGTLTLDLQGKGQMAQPFDLQAKARMPSGGEGVAVVLEALQIKNADHRITLAQPARFRQDAQGMALQDLKLKADDGTLAATFAQRKGRYELALSGQKVPIGLADLAVPNLPLRGAVTFDGGLSGQKGSLTLKLTDGALPEADVKGLGMTFQADLGPKSLTAEGQITGFGDQPVELQAALPMRFGADGLPQPVTTQAVSAAVQWRGPVASLWALVPVVGHRLTGDAALQASMQGTLDQPIFAGQATVNKGRYENLEWGTVLDALEVSATLQGDGAVAVESSASDGENGRVTARVKMTPQDGQQPDVAAMVTLASAQLVRRDDLEVTLDGEIRYEGPAASGALTGALRTQGVEVRLTDSLGGGVQTLPVVEINRQAANLPPLDGAEEETETAAAPITLDLTITLPGQVFVRGQGLDSEWKGGLHVGGTASKPLVKGDLSVVRGGFSVVGKDFSLNKGVITFTGGERINPGLDIRAVHTTDDIVASVIVGGTAKRPALSLESTPSLPSDEILSRVLFGSSVGKLSASQALSVAQAAAALSGQGGSGPGISDMLRSSLGLDVLSFGGGGDDGPGGVEVGKYVAEGVYVGVEQGLTPESSGVTVEVELTPRISVETKATGAAGADVGVNYKFNY